MRKLMICALSLSLAVFLSYYLMPISLLLPASAACAGLSLFCFFVRKRSGALYRLFLCALGAALGFTIFALHWNRTVRYAQEWDETAQTFQAVVMEAPEAYDRYTRLHVQRMEAPKLDLMLYDYGESLSLCPEEETEPGCILTVTAKLRRADLRYGEKNNSYVSKNIYLTGTLQALETGFGRSRTLRTLAASASGEISHFADSFFSRDTAVFLRALMLGDKTDFYQDIPLYASMRGAGFMHIVAVSGVQYRFFGKRRSARKPVNWALFGTSLLLCT